MNVLFFSTKKSETQIQILKDEEDRLRRCDKARIELELQQKKEFDRVKIIQPLDNEKMEDVKKQTLQFVSQCKKKEYIYDYFRRMNSNLFYKNSCEPSLNELSKIILATIPKDEEKELRKLFNCLHYDHIIIKDVIAKTHSIVIVDTLYDFCKSVDLSIAEISRDFTSSLSSQM